MPRIKITGTAITATHGTLVAGDILNLSDEFAAHLVNDCKVAEYLDMIEPTETKQPETPETKKSRKLPKQQFDDAEPAAETPASIDDVIDTGESI